MTKIILISGSPRLNGNTMSMMDKMSNKIKELGGEADIISFHGKKINSCIACNSCKKTGKCALDDGVNEMIDRIRDCQGLIVGSPVYFGTARGDMMNFLQRLGMVSYGGNRFLSGKVGGPIAVARRGGLTATIQEMLMFFFINDMIVPGSNYWNMAFGKGPGEALQDNEGVSTLVHFAENVYNIADKLSK